MKPSEYNLPRQQLPALVYKHTFSFYSEGHSIPATNPEDIPLAYVRTVFVKPLKPHVTLSHSTKD